MIDFISRRGLLNNRYKPTITAESPCWDCTNGHQKGRWPLLFRSASEQPMCANSTAAKLCNPPERPPSGNLTAAMRKADQHRKSALLESRDQNSEPLGCREARRPSALSG